ncbi:hypothetical protein [Sphingobacterium daejeonense]|uniref:hypothetical protein n=1 Tax=Sphingobacterium daejeonense TaxID=371142 RepID=UPI0010C4C1F2|nr:hypothetical protein [Sphingobacterium daejeonense]VTP93093.1 Uncharacterised protein [Sphingobacterium daejeonense]
MFLTKAEEKSYQYDRTNAASLAVDYAEGLAKKDKDAEATRFATTLYKNAAAFKAPTIQAGAISVLTSINPAKQKKQLIKLASNEDKLLRNVALGLLAEDAKAGDLVKLAGSIRKLDGDAQESILNFLATEDATGSVKAIEKSFPALKDEEAKIAALNALSVLTKGQNADFLIKQIPTASEKELAVIKTLLLSSKDTGTIDAVNAALANADVKTQVALLEVLSQRTNAASAAAVLPLTASADAAVRLAAFKALPTTVNPDNLEAIIQLLDKATGEEAAYAQQAAILAINASPDKDAKIQRLAANISRSAAPSAGKYFPIFAGVGGSDALKAVENYVGSDGPLKAEAIQALANWSNAESLPILIRLSKTEKDPAVFNTVFNGLIKQLNASDVNPEQKNLVSKRCFCFSSRC